MSNPRCYLSSPLLAVLLSLCFGGVTALAQSAPKIEPMYGPAMAARLNGLDEQGRFQLGDNQSIPWTSIRRITFPQTTVAAGTERWQLVLVGQGQLSTDRVVFDGESVEVRTTLGTVPLPIEQIQQFRDRNWAATANRSALPSPLLDEDQLVVEIEGQTQTIAGLLESIEPDKVLFSFEGEVRELPIERVKCVVMASAGWVTKETGVSATLTNGDRLFGTPVGWDEAGLELSLAGLQTLKIPAGQLHSLEIKSDQLRFVSELEPSSASVSGLVLPPRPWRRDLSVTGEPLQAITPGTDSGWTTFASGLGLPSISELSFDVDGYDRFVAVVGLDPTQKRLGDCEIAVIASGQEVFRARLRSEQPTVDVDVALNGSQTLTLKVEAGERLELADHVNWCDARLLKTAMLSPQAP